MRYVGPLLTLQRTSKSCFATGQARLIADRSGAAAIEFALLLPVLVLLYIGAVELGDGFTAKRKVTSMTSAIGDLITRTKDISSSEMSGILADVPRAVLAPYPVAGNKVEVTASCAAIDKDKVATVKWSEASNAAKEGVGQQVDLPAGVSLANSKLVFVDVTYKYSPKIGAFVTGDPVDLSSTFYFKPREAGTVCYNGVCC